MNPRAGHKPGRPPDSPDGRRYSLLAGTGLGNGMPGWLSVSSPKPTNCQSRCALRSDAALIAELGSQAVGYLLYCQAYDLDLGGRILYVIDLFVSEGTRRRGVARALMEAAAEICRQMEGQELLWSVYAPNKMAAAFYEKLGAQYIRELNFMHRLA
jgi:ribosomal protein S18 acetylase RimI-like enzyme